MMEHYENEDQTGSRVNTIPTGLTREEILDRCKDILVLSMSISAMIIAVLYNVR